MRSDAIRCYMRSDAIRCYMRSDAKAILGKIACFTRVGGRIGAHVFLSLLTAPCQAVNCNKL